MPELNTALLKKRKLKNPVKVRSYDYSIPEPKAKKTKTSSFNNSSANMHIDNGIKKQDVSIVKELTSKPACNEKQVSKNTSTLITKTKPLEIQKERKTISTEEKLAIHKLLDEASLKLNAPELRLLKAVITETNYGEFSSVKISRQTLETTYKVQSKEVCKARNMLSSFNLIEASHKSNSVGRGSFLSYSFNGPYSLSKFINP